MRYLLILITILLIWQPTFAAVTLIDPTSSVMYVDEGFENPYVVEISDQEGKRISRSIRSINDNI